IRGEVGSKVRLLVEHPDGGREEIDIVRDRVTLEDSDAEHSIEEIRGRKLGVVRLPSFYVDPTGRQNGKRASQDVKAALSERTDDERRAVLSATAERVYRLAAV
ncbi:MAG: hypothetical protein AAGF49_14955, partial [Pseudomonadota bacterium]